MVLKITDECKSGKDGSIEEHLMAKLTAKWLVIWMARYENGWVVLLDWFSSEGE